MSHQIRNQAVSSKPEKEGFHGFQRLCRGNTGAESFEDEFMWMEGSEMDIPG